MKISFILTKIISSILVILIVVSATFLLLRILPGGPFDTEKKLPPRVKNNIEKKYKLDQVIEAHKDLEGRKILGPAVILP